MKFAWINGILEIKNGQLTSKKWTIGQLKMDISPKQNRLLGFQIWTFKSPILMNRLIFPLMVCSPSNKNFKSSFYPQKVMVLELFQNFKIYNYKDEVVSYIPIFVKHPQEELYG